MAVINKVQQSNIYSSIESNIKKQKKPTDDKDNSKKQNFITSTFSELRKVNWPGPIHVLKWSLVTVIFCAVLAMFLSYSDNVFSSSISYSDCLVKVARNETGDSRGDCTREYLNKLVLRD